MRQRLPFSVLVFCTTVVLPAPRLRAMPADVVMDGLHVRVVIDGRSLLVVQGNSLYWHHLTWVAPGRAGDPPHPVYINGIEWRPEWPADGPNRSCRCDSSKFREMLQPLPAAPVAVTLEKQEGRGPVRILQEPSAGNDYTLIVDFDDGSQGGGVWYDVRISWEPIEPAAAKPTSETVVLLIQALDVTIKDGQPAKLNLSPVALGLERVRRLRPVAEKPDPNEAVTVACAPSLRELIRSLERQGKVKVHHEQRMFAMPGEACKLEVFGGKPGALRAVFQAKTEIIDRKKGLIKLHFWTSLAPVETPQVVKLGAPLLLVENGWGVVEPNVSRSMLQTTVMMQDGCTLFVPLNRVEVEGGRTESLLLVTARLFSYR